MFTLCYPFRPWAGSRAIVDGPSILAYLRETAREYGIDRSMRFHHRVTAAAWSSDDGRWTVEVERVDMGESVQMTCGFLFTCTGYYRNDEGYTPPFRGVQRFGGQIVHPQFWSEDVDHAGKRVVVIGSGATAVTLVPALARSAAHVTMLQRSPSYILLFQRTIPSPACSAASCLRESRIRSCAGRSILIALTIYRLSRRQPETMKRMLRRLMERRLPPGYDIDRHFTPHYEPWDQRLCLAPDNDLFEQISAGGVSVVTDEIDTFTERGLALSSGVDLEADLIVTSTGLNMVPIGGIRLTVDDAEVELPKAIIYRGMMLSGVPNMAFAFGYTNQSWTLGADLTCRAGLHAAGPHGPPRLRTVHTAPARRDGWRGAVRDPHLGLHPARASRVPAPGDARPVAAATELRPQPPVDAARSRRRSRARVLSRRDDHGCGGAARGIKTVTQLASSNIPTSTRIRQPSPATPRSRGRSAGAAVPSRTARPYSSRSA